MKDLSLEGGRVSQTDGAQAATFLLISTSPQASVGSVKWGEPFSASPALSFFSPSGLGAVIIDAVMLCLES